MAESIRPLHSCRSLTIVSVSVVAVLFLGAGVSHAQMVLDSYTGPITQNELDSFKRFMQTRAIPPHPWGFNDTDHNYISDGPAGRDVEAMGLMYQATADVEILDRMIEFVDAFVNMRNDLDGGTQVVMWTGDVDPVWPGNGPAHAPSNYAGGENGDTIAHIEYCALLILKTPALWGVAVSDGDPYGFGATYLDRALTYVARTDEANDQYSYKYFVTADNLIRNPPDWPRGFHTMEAINIQMMLDGGFERDAEIHELLGDDPDRVARYDAAVRTSVRECLEGMKHAYSAGGQTVYKWGYYPWSTSLNESVGHANYDLLGIWRAWTRDWIRDWTRDGTRADRYGITTDEVMPIAEAFVYVISLGGNQFTANVDGSGATMNRIDGEWMVAADWDPAVYDLIAHADVANGRYATTPGIAAAVLWMKQRLFGAALPPGWSDSDIGSPGQAGSASGSVSSTGGTFTVSGGGADVWGASDQFNYTSRTISGDFTITARVAAQQDTNAWAKSGVMIRETADPGSAYVFLFVTPSHGVSLQYRSHAGASAAEAADLPGTVAPYWLKLLRSGTTFIGFASTDGSDWWRVGTVQVRMANTVSAGLAVTAHDDNSLNTSTFDGVSLVPTPAGLVPTPPMGWNSWNHFHCGVTDAIVRAQADAMVASGMRDVGYTYINIDDCWEGQRDDQGFIQPDSTRFPDMRNLSDYVHGLGLRLGIYSSPGPLTCQRRPGSLGYEMQDAQTYADWGVDYLKYDWCSAGQAGLDEQTAYWTMSEALKATGRPIVLSMSQYGRNQVWTWGAAVGGNLWRVSGDISDNYDRMAGIGFGQNGREIYAGPGHWNDPDMLEIGNGHMSFDEYRTHMTLWCLLAAPLIAGNDLTRMSEDTLALLTNVEVLSVDQDPAGVQGHRVSQAGGLEVWAKLLSDGSYAMGLFNRTLEEAQVTADVAALGFSGTVAVRDLWNQQDLGTFDGNFSADVPPHGAVMIRVAGAGGQ